MNEAEVIRLFTLKPMEGVVLFWKDKSGVNRSRFGSEDDFKHWAVILEILERF